MQDKITIADAPDCLNTNDKAMWVLGYQAAIEARSTCLLQIQEPPTKTEALAHYSKQAILAMDEAAPAAVAVPDAVRDALLQSEAALEVATARILKADPVHSISVTSEAKALVAVRAALAATPAAAPVALTIPQPLGYVVTTPAGADLFYRHPADLAIHNDHRAETVYTLPAVLAAAPVVLPEPAVIATSKRESPTKGSVEFTWGVDALKEEGEHKLFTEQQLRAQLATGGKAQAVEVDDSMALAFHHAITDGAIGQDDLNEIKIRLRAALVNLHAPQAQADARDALTPAARDVLAERARQIAKEGYDPEHDDHHLNDEIAAMAALFIMPEGACDWDATSTSYGDTLGEAMLPCDWEMPNFGDEQP
ncbi:hypothetical protein [Comamonas sp. 26]|uniref:hypothetical protein n=1 Tax=Comamonas sp. 26 TaxID=2035201 RepID=UPI000C175823|nr:hypothetical protein [Comamonas sp. 26]PIG09745.1 hypothetical protein CLU84_2690 [Comamonas sp. 26]